MMSFREWSKINISKRNRRDHIELEHLNQYNQAPPMVLNRSKYKLPSLIKYHKNREVNNTHNNWIGRN